MADWREVQMKPEERENCRYAAGGTNAIDVEEKAMFSLLPEPPGQLLDVGCGIGTITRELEKRGFQTWGIDFSEVGVQKALENGVRAKVCDVDANGIPFDGETFEVVWCSDVVEHVFDPLYLLEEVCRVLKPDGVTLISTPNDLTAGNRLRFMLGRSPQSDVYRKYRQCKHHTVFSKELLEYMVHHAGLRKAALLGICAIPRTSRKFVTRNPLVLTLLGRTFVLKAVK
jgi:2-polyprenyl-3-methyl-5-hydroxy-6-metoxy-1,4-benzoquinol methylase